MKNVLLVGDSIRMGYEKAVKKALEGKANVYVPDDNCRFSLWVFRYIHTYQKLLPEGEEVDVLHWNAGLHDCLRLLGEEPNVPLDIYAYYIERICVRIKNVYPKAKVIFATSTSVQEEKMREDFKRCNKDIKEYNATAVEIVKKHGFEVNDLYTTSVSLPDEAHSDAVHYYTTLGTEAFANQVLSFIAPALGLEDIPVYKEKPSVDEPTGAWREQ